MIRHSPAQTSAHLRRNYQQIVADAKEYKLTPSERKRQLSLGPDDADRTRRGKADGRREDPNARFIAQVLGLVETPFGLIETSVDRWI